MTSIIYVRHLYFSDGAGILGYPLVRNICKFPFMSYKRGFQLNADYHSWVHSALLQAREHRCTVLDTLGHSRSGYLKNAFVLRKTPTPFSKTMLMRDKYPQGIPNYDD